MKPYKFNPTLRVFVFFLTLFPGLVLSITAQDEPVPAEYAELMALVEQEKNLINRLDSKVAPDKLDTEIQMRIDEIAEAYEAYIDRYPNSVFAKLIYGKFLRKTDQPKRANELFLDIHEEFPDLPVVNQQLALYASEKGDLKKALHFFQKTLELDPTQALYHYQYGEFLYAYKTALIKGNHMPISEVESQMESSFRRAHEMEPGNRDFHMRWAESYHDIFNPDWEKILPEWNTLLETSRNSFEKDVIRLQKARVLIKLSRFFEARQLVEAVSDPALEDSRHQVSKLLP
jgi:tetratricopeptide (TPR) repeat protein